MDNIVFCAFGTERLSAEELDKMMAFLPQDRILKSRRYRQVNDRMNCIAAYFMLLYGLAKEYGLLRIPCVETNQYGKPFFREPVNISFNLSHCRGAVCCALSPWNIGVDIQDPIDHPESLFDLVMSKGEREAILASPAPETLCAKYWSQKEAYLKYMGTGLTDDVSAYDFSAYSEDCFGYRNRTVTTKNYNDYTISVCSEAGQTIFVFNDITNYIQDFYALYPAESAHIINTSVIY